MMQWNGWWHMGSMWSVWIAAMVISLVVVVALALAVRAYGSAAAGGGSAASGRAEEILKERYARGEIDRTEFQTRLEDLRH